MIAFFARAFRAIFYGFVVFFFIRLFQTLFRPKTPSKGPSKKHAHRVQRAPRLIEDPVCGVFFPEDRAVVVRDRESGKMYRVCSQTCAKRLMETSVPQSRAQNS